ncbi:hypothetical protein O1611_g9690 [Lasiodiplodia mahajangana]|uniref:Uncharacterized protein n=1 Tax=Lasiodiplodia mahajangana TaxID=1108764 RepID=A0ACC2J6K1_9PEZI|nr:hypothetical protein O1611_g9690 [Lasiodiplodia mahajangana]
MFSSTGSFDSFDHSSNEWSRNSTWSSHSGGFSQAAYNGSSTFGVINELKFLAAKSSRQSTIILAAFNIVSAAATAAGILVNIFTCVRGPDVYPFILSLGIVGQGIIFAVSQAQGLDSLFRPGCALISQFMWPAIFIVPYIQLVFTIETTIRALKSNPFPPRSKWTVAICLTIVKIALLATGLLTFFIRAPNFCFASLFWFVAKWAEGGFALLIGIVMILAMCNAIIYIKLTRHSTIEEDERVDASRMIYYIALAIIPNALMIPFFGYLSFGNPFENDGDTGLTLSMVSTVVANVTGLMTGGLYLFLRSSTGSSIAPKNKVDEYERQQIKYQIRGPKPNDTDFNSHIMKPVTAPQWLRELEPEEKRLAQGEISPRGLQDSSRFRSIDGTNPLGSNAVFKQTPILGGTNDTQTPSSITQVRKTSSYALFPNKNQGIRASNILLPSTTYSPNASEPLAHDCCDMLQPPPSVQPPGFRHRRDSSMASSATVQIGLRLSNVEDVRPTTMSTISSVERTHELGCPNKPKVGVAGRPSPLITLDSMAPLPGSQRPLGASQVDTTTKTLPPIPRDSQTEVERAPILNPTVYSPNSPTKGKVPSPKGVGFNIPMRTVTTPIEAVELSSSASRLPANSTSDGGSSADWI